MQTHLSDQVKILISSEGGQGGQVLAAILAESANRAGDEVAFFPHYGVERRGGISLAYLTISSKPITNPRFSQADIVVVTTWRQIDIPRKYWGGKTLLIDGLRLNHLLFEHFLPLKSLNILILGILMRELNQRGYQLDFQEVKKVLEEKLKSKPGWQKNLAAFELGLTLEKNLYYGNLERIKKPALRPLVDQDKKKIFTRFPHLCKGCGLCIEKCPQKALAWSEDLNFLQRPMPKVDLEKCRACRICEQICPDSAMRIIKN